MHGVKREPFEPEVEEYLSFKGGSTKNAYSSAYIKFLKFYRRKYGEDKGFGHYLDRIYEEFKKPPREQKRVAEIELKEFIDFLVKEEKHSNNAVRLYFAAVQNFLKYKQVTVSMGFLGNMPSANEKEANGKHEWKIEQIEQFVDAAPSYREKAIILAMFQSGLGVNEISELDYKDVQDELEKGILPVCLKLVRQKTDVKFKTFFGRDTVKYLKLYLATRGTLQPEDPLFIKERMRNGDERISVAAIEQSFGEMAKTLGFITYKHDEEERKQKGRSEYKPYNPARPHSLRAAFNSRLVGKIDETLREFWMGHAIGGVARAYLTMPTEEMRKLYTAAEEYLCIEKTSRQELEERAGGEPAVAEEKIKALEEQIAEMYKFVHKNLDPVLDLYIEITSTPEGKAVLDKILERKLQEAAQ